MTPRRAGSRRPSEVRRQLTVFYTVAATTVVVLAVGAIASSRAVARDAALDESERRTVRLAELVVAPLLEPSLDGDVQSRRDLQRTVDFRKAEGDLTEVTVWSLDRGVVFTDEPLQPGEPPEPLPAEAEAAIRDGTTYAAFEDSPEVTLAGYDADNPGFVEVYVPLRLKSGETLAFEVYYDYRRVDEVAQSLLWNILPLVLVPLLLLQIVQVPIAASLARRIRRQEAERARLLEQALSQSDRERVRIAADLHDGPIQELAGIGYALATFVPALPDQHRPLADRVGATVHHAIDSLRRMMVDIYPPDLTSGEFSQTLEGLATPLRERGVAVEFVDDADLPELDAEAITALYRVAREALLNVAAHAEATTVLVTLSVVGPGRVRLTVTDDGVGMTDADMDRRAEGHLGLRLLQDRVRGMGGELTLTSPDGGGTRVTAEVPTTGAS